MTPAARIAAVIEILSELPSGQIASVSAGAALRRGSVSYTHLTLPTTVFV